MAAVHGNVYSGPTWIEEPDIQEALKAVGLPSSLPIPFYPGTEAGIFLKKYQEIQLSTTTFTEHAWEEPGHEEAVFLGTYKECYQWLSEHGAKASRVVEPPRERRVNEVQYEYYITGTGRLIDKGEEAAFFAQFEDTQ
jgi:hypothetical protein